MRELTSPSPDDRVLGALLAASMFDPTADKVAAVLARIAETPDRRLFLLEDGPGAIGLVAICQDGPASAKITHIAVDPRMRGRNAGRQMLRELAEEHGYRRLSAETDAEAVGFYARCGFKVESLGEKYPGVERFLCTFEAPRQS